MFNSMERRTNPRNKFSCFARCRQLNAGTPDSEGLCVIEDFSHDGIHFLFLSDVHALQQHMRLLLKFPYIEQSPMTDREFLVEVMRINSLFPGRCGVGARLVQPMPLARHGSLFLPEMALPNRALVDPASQKIDFYA
jgi:hypothetical protein